VFTHQNNTSQNSALGGFVIDGVITNDKILTKDNMPYILGNITISSGKTLTLKEGVILKTHTHYTSIIVSGTLNIQGTKEEKVYITSLKDDSVGGDTNNDGNTTTPAPKDWSNIIVYSAGVFNANNAEISYGGYIRYGCGYPFYCSGGISNNGGDINIRNSHIFNNYGYGIYQISGSSNISFSEISNTEAGYAFNANSGSAILNFNNIHDNDLGGVYNTFSNSQTINAKNNYWGDPSGPYHPTKNPRGIGDRVSNYVDFSNWLGSSNISLPTLSYSEENGYNNDLTSQGIEPNKGTASSTKFIFKILYENQNNIAPQSVNLIIGNGSSTSTYPMIKDTKATSTPELYDDDYTNKEQYIYQDIAHKEKYQYHFEASDGINTIRLPETGELSFEAGYSNVLFLHGTAGSRLYEYKNDKLDVCSGGSAYNYYKRWLPVTDCENTRLLLNLDGLSQ
jgi:hypothetical protein